jgi:integral membrane protein
MTVLRQFRLVAFLEGSSFVILLFVAMPLKYLAGFPLAVRVVGSIHGALFLVFLVALYRAARGAAWPRRRSLAAFVSSILPFGTFVFDASLRREIESMKAVADTREPTPLAARSPLLTGGLDGLDLAHGGRQRFLPVW